MLATHLLELHIQNAIIITDSEPTCQAKKEISSIELLNLEFYTYGSLIHNITNHIYSPEIVKSHIEHSNQTTYMKTISISDPQIMHLGLKAGDIVSIQYSNEPTESRRIIY